jgi:hypothetical protein
VRLVLPKASRGYTFPRLFLVELNDFDVERLLPSLFFLVVTRGRGRGRNVNDPRDLRRYVEALADHPHVENFDSETGRRLLERWIRASVVRMGRAGRARVEEQMEFVLPLTLLAYKPGFPAEIRRQRNVHQFIYELLTARLAEAGYENPQRELNGFFYVAFGHGVRIGDAPKYDGGYDGVSRIDLQALLALYFLDGFEPTGASGRETGTSPSPALPRSAHRLSDGLLRYLLAYQSRVPTLELTRGLMALINLELLVYTLELQLSTNELVRTRELSGLMSVDGGGEGSPRPDLYVDFTRERGGMSDDLARACVDRHLEELRTFLTSSMRLRTIDRFVSTMPEITSWLYGHPTPTQLKLLAELASDARVQARAQMEVEHIRHESTTAAQGDTEVHEIAAFVDDALRASDGDAVDAAVRLLVSAQEKRAVQNMVSWYWSVGGIQQPFGLLAGNLRGRRNWRYAMSDDLLAALVRLAMIDSEGAEYGSERLRDRLRLQDFLSFLEHRYGILVGRPPDFLDDARARASASTNLGALKRRLRQIGYFEALSDDFTAQYLTAPGMEPAPA